jgi:hypothetical protein
MKAMNPQFEWGTNKIKFEGDLCASKAMLAGPAPSAAVVANATPNDAMARSFVHEYTHYLQSLVCMHGVTLLNLKLAIELKLAALPTDSTAVLKPKLHFVPELQTEERPPPWRITRVGVVDPPRVDIFHSAHMSPLATTVALSSSFDLVPLRTVTFCEGMARLADRAYVHHEGAPTRKNDDPTTEARLYSLVATHLRTTFGLSDDLISAVCLLALASEFPDIAFAELCEELSTSQREPETKCAVALAQRLINKNLIGRPLLAGSLAGLQRSSATNLTLKSLFSVYEALCLKALDAVLNDPLIWAPSKMTWSGIQNLLRTWGSPVVLAANDEVCLQICGENINTVPFLNAL